MKDREVVAVIDDDVAVLRTVEILLKNQPYRTLSFPRAEQARQFFQSAVPDVVLLDVMMPDESGVEFCKWLRSKEAFSGIPVVFLSALDPTDQIEEAFDVGGTDYMIKPLKGVELRARLKLILETRRQALELERQLEIRRQLGNIALHDIRDPIWTIREHIEKIGSSLEAAEQTSSFRAIESACGQISNLCDNVLWLATAEVGKLKIRRSRFSVQGFLEKLGESISFSMRQKGCTLSFDPKGSIEDLFVDSAMFERVFENLVYNALRFANPGTEILICWGLIDNQFRLDIRNEGVLLEPGIQEKVFDPFVGEGNREGQINFGVGLSFARFCVELHGGKISASNWYEDDADLGSRKSGVEVSISIPDANVS